MGLSPEQWASLAEMHRELRRSAAVHIETYGFLAASEGMGLDEAIDHLAEGWNFYECPQ